MKKERFYKCVNGRGWGDSYVEGFVYSTLWKLSLASATKEYPEDFEEVNNPQNEVSTYFQPMPIEEAREVIKENNRVKPMLACINL